MLLKPAVSFLAEKVNEFITACPEERDLKVSLDRAAGLFTLEHRIIIHVIPRNLDGEQDTEEGFPCPTVQPLGCGGDLNGAPPSAVQECALAVELFRSNASSRLEIRVFMVRGLEPEGRIPGLRGIHMLLNDVLKLQNPVPFGNIGVHTAFAADGGAFAGPSAFRESL
jgi:hypothetical protein